LKFKERLTRGFVGSRKKHILFVYFKALPLQVAENKKVIIMYLVPGYVKTTYDHAKNMTCSLHQTELKTGKYTGKSFNLKFRLTPCRISYS